MGSSFLAAVMILAVAVLAGCGGNTETMPPEPFDLEGEWLYLGPWDGEHTLEISSEAMVYADISGKWSSNWSIKEYDNGLQHFQITFDSGTGTYYPEGKNMSGAYVLSEVILTVQLTEGTGAYPPVQSPSSCTEEDSTLIPDCRMYMKQN